MINRIEKSGDKDIRETDDITQSVKTKREKKQQDELQTWQRDVFEDCELEAPEQFKKLSSEDIPEKEMKKLEEWQEHAFRFMKVRDFAPNN